MKHILSLAFAMEGPNFDQTFDFLGDKVRITHFATNFNQALTSRLIKEYDGNCDAIALSGIPPTIKFKSGEFIHPLTQKFTHLSKETMVMDGSLLKEVYLPWSMRQFYLENSNILEKKRVGVYTGSFQRQILEIFEEFKNPLVMADLYYVMKWPLLFHNISHLEMAIKLFAPLLRKLNVRKGTLSDFKPATAPFTLREFFECQVFVGAMSNIGAGGIDLTHLEGKILILDFLTPEIELKLKQAGVHQVVSLLPHMDLGPFVNFAIFEACLQALHPETHQLTENDLLKWVSDLDLRPRIKYLNPPKGEDLIKFGFIVHPLSTKHLFYHRKLKWISKYSTPMEKVAENLIGMAPGFFYGKIIGVKSLKNGQEVEGLIYTTTETPRKMLEKNPETVYRKLVKLCTDAGVHGAKIVGLGAYTKVVGDAGVTVARRSPVPVTTGNALSAASTLWAAKYAVVKMGQVSQGTDEMIEGTVMVIGATGSIGAVSAKILAMKWKHVILVAPRAHKLLELKSQMEKMGLTAKIDVATNPDEYLAQCHLIITTTSAKGERVLDIMKVRPGCVICDVSRPFDIGEEDALKRPDVMVIASGEVELPGDVEIQVNLGLEGQAVYACLAETAILAMERKFESFTLSRNISYEKVIEIDRLAREHGVKLSHIMGHQGVICDEEFELCREHTKLLLKNW